MNSRINLNNVKSEWPREKASLLTTQKKSQYNMEAYTDGSKSTGRKEGFAAAFADFTKRGALP